MDNPHELSLGTDEIRQLLPFKYWLPEAAYADMVALFRQRSGDEIRQLREALKGFCDMRLFVQAYDGRVFDKARMLAHLDAADALLAVERLGDASPSQALRVRHVCGACGREFPMQLVERP